ncbi:MAG: hypothetical protein HC883_04850 [Bdellovibrionaceae bacterium]|nr:hypothetical protein [Pseudobdellovibrionaceae bacterium]
MVSDRDSLSIGERAAGSFAGKNKKQFAQYLRDKGLDINYDEASDNVFIKGKPIDPSGFNLTTREGLSEAAKDIADLTGESLPVVGAILGGLAGIPAAAAAGIPTAGIGALAVESATSGAGAMAGRAIKDMVGQKMGVQEPKPFAEEVQDLGKEGAVTAGGTLVGGVAGRKIAQGAKLVWDQGVPSLLKTFQGLPTKWGEKFVKSPGKFGADKILSDEEMIGLSQKAMSALDDYREVVKKKRAGYVRERPV